MRVLLAGLWSRRGLNAAAFLVIVTAVTAAVLGPMYGRASAEHLVDSRIAAQPSYATGLSVAMPGASGRALPRGNPDNAPGEDPLTVVDSASDVMDGRGVARFWGPETSWLRDTGPRITHNQRVLMVPLYWREGMCDLAAVQGRCPAAPGEVLVQRTMARTLGIGAGDKLPLSYQVSFVRERRVQGRLENTEVTKTRTRAFDVVGTYTIDEPGSAAWYDDSRFVGYEHLDPAAVTGPQAGSDPAAPALLVAPGSMTSQDWVGGVDRLVDTGAVDLDTMDATDSAARAFINRALNSVADNPAQDLELGTIFEGVRSEQTLLSRVMIAALAPLLVLALLLLFALVSAGAAARRPHVALAKLRGHSRAQVFRFAVAEPFLVVAVATPVALALAVGTAHLVARTWLTPGIPVQTDATTWFALLAVVLAALAATAVAALDVIREPLARALASAISVRGGSRVGLVLRSAVVAVAVASVVQLVTSGDQSSQLLALLAPLFITLAVAVGGAALLRAVSRWWTRRTTSTGGTPAYLASRRLARRPDLANLMIPLLLAVSVITFATTAAAVSDDWRVSRARADAGAAQRFQTAVSPGRLLDLTREVDPEGRYLAAALVNTDGDEMGRRLHVDASRLARVVAWDDAWSDQPVQEIQRRLVPNTAHRIRFAGNTVSVSLRGVRFRGGAEDDPTLWIQYVNEDGEQRNEPLGRLREGAGPATLTGTVRECDDGCVLDQLFIAGKSLSVLDVDGRLTLTRVAVDHRPVDWGLTDPGAWRAARPFPVSLVDPPVVPTAGPAGLRLRLYLGHLPPGDGGAPGMISGTAGITPTTTPDVAPVVITEGTGTTPAARAGSGIAMRFAPSVVEGTALNGDPVPMDVVARTKALPVLGSTGSMADLESALVEFEPPPGAVVFPELWAGPDTPPAMLDEVRDQGVQLTPIADLDDRLAELRTDAFSLGLRLFLLVGLVTLLLAVFGVFAGAVLQSRWRSYEVASLRVVGVPQRSLLRASVQEYVVMLGLAVLLGVASAFLAVRLVLPSISLGPADEFEPEPIYLLHPEILGGVGLVVFLLATLIALVVSWRTTRLGRPSTLRWAEQG